MRLVEQVATRLLGIFVAFVLLAILVSASSIHGRVTTTPTGKCGTGVADLQQMITAFRCVADVLGR